MRFFPQGDDDLREMLAIVGVSTPADLFRSIPERLRLTRDLALPPAQSEMEISNASLYDGASAFAEGILMGARVTKRRKMVISEAIHPHYRQVARSYVRNMGIEIIEVPVATDGRTDQSRLRAAVGAGEPPAAVALQNPNS